MADLIEKDLSYRVTGVLYDVYNYLGGGYQEKYYQRATAIGLSDCGLKYQEQLSIPLSYKGESIGRYFLDFLIENRIVLEIKSAPQFYSRDIKQILSYLDRSDVALGILVNFGRHNVEIKRILRGGSTGIRDNSSQELEKD